MKNQQALIPVVVMRLGHEELIFGFCQSGNTVCFVKSLLNKYEYEFSLKS